MVGVSAGCSRCSRSPGGCDAIRHGRPHGVAGGLVVRLRQPGRRHGLRGRPLGLRPRPRGPRCVRGWSSGSSPEPARRSRSSCAWSFGPIADRTGRYWSLTIVGYALTAVCVPLIALAPRLGARRAGLRLDDDPARAARQGGPVAVEVGAAGPRRRRRGPWPRLRGAQGPRPGRARSPDRCCGRCRRGRLPLVGHGRARRPRRGRDGRCCSPCAAGSPTRACTTTRPRRAAPEHRGAAPRLVGGCRRVGPAGRLLPLRRRRVADDAARWSPSASSATTSPSTTWCPSRPSPWCTPRRWASRRSRRSPSARSTTAPARGCCSSCRCWWRSCLPSPSARPWSRSWAASSRGAWPRACRTRRSRRWSPTWSTRRAARRRTASSRDPGTPRDRRRRQRRVALRPLAAGARGRRRHHPGRGAGPAGRHVQAVSTPAPSRMSVPAPSRIR